MNNDNIELQDRDQNEEEIDLVALIREYLRFWPIYLIALVLCTVLAWLFITTSKPKYPVKTSVLFIDQKEKGGMMVPGLEFSGLTMGVQNVNVDNEMQILRSREIVKMAVEESGEYISISSKSGLRRKTWYNELPFYFSMDSISRSKIKTPLDIELEPLGGDKYLIHLNDNDGTTIRVDSLPMTFAVEESLIAMLPKAPKGDQTTLSNKFYVTFYSPLRVAIQYAEKGDLTVARSEKQGSIAVLSIESENRQKGEAFLSKLIEVYNRERAIEKNATAQNTYNFINERIDLIGKELSDTEQQLEAIKKSQGVTSYEDLGIVVSSSANMDRQRAEAETQIQLVDFLVSDLKRKEGTYEIIPGSLGFTDGTLNTAIELYNRMVFDRNNLLESAQADHPRVMNVTRNLNTVRENILEAAAVAKQGLEIQLEGLRDLERSYASKILQAPTFERISMDIERQRSIRSNLYLMLLTRREETSIELAASLESASIVDTPLAEHTPSSPRKPIIYLAGLLMGLILPTIGIFIWKLTRTKVVTEDDVRSLTNLPLAGTIPKNEEDALADRKELVVKTHGNSVMTEVFRTLRTNIGFLTGNKRPLVIMGTSTLSGEGKTFVTSNLAISLSALDQKVLLVGLDIRNPQLKRTFGLGSEVSPGIADILNDNTLDPFDLILKTKDYPNLSILNTGNIPPNPPELLARPRLDQLFKLFREHFDYIVVDAAPVGPVVDSMVLSRVVDLTLYVVRSGSTEKRDFDYINYLNANHKLPNMSIVLNDIDMSDSTFAKGYGYGYGYGYGRKDVKKEKGRK